MLTPKLVKQARAVSRSQWDQGQVWDDFRTSTQKWAGHVRDLIEATQEANLPYIHTVTVFWYSEEYVKIPGHVSNSCSHWHCMCSEFWQ